MSRNNETRQALTSQIANGLKDVAARMKPFARSAKAATTRGVHTTRKWSAPRVERTGQVLQDSVAPKVASALSTAAERLDPGKPRHARWRLPTGIATVTAAAGAAAAVALRRKQPSAASSAEQDGTASAEEMSDSRATTSAGGQEESS